MHLLLIKNISQLRWKSVQCRQNKKQVGMYVRLQLADKLRLDIQCPAPISGLTGVGRLMLNARPLASALGSVSLVFPLVVGLQATRSTKINCIPVFWVGLGLMTLCEMPMYFFLRRHLKRSKGNNILLMYEAFEAVAVGLLLLTFRKKLISLQLVSSQKEEMVSPPHTCVTRAL